jgi:protein-tyrosine phosphatase
VLYQTSNIIKPVSYYSSFNKSSNNNQHLHTNKNKFKTKSFLTSSLDNNPNRTFFNYSPPSTSTRPINLNSIKHTINTKKPSSNTNYMPSKLIKPCPMCNHSIPSFTLSSHLSTHPSNILPWLYLGSYKNASDIKGLNVLNIKYVLNCASECVSLYDPNIKMCHLKLIDHPEFNILPFLGKAVSFIKEAKDNGCNCLVHCQMGISRSASCVIAYFIKELGYNVFTAFQFIKRRRNIVCPNFGFIQQLCVYEKSVKCK